MSAFEDATTLTPIAPGQLRAQVPDGWQQGRGAFGGLSLGLLARALTSAEPDPKRVMRALTGDICGPVVPGDATLEVDVLRRGANLTNIDAKLRQGDGVQARASCVMSTSRKVEIAPHMPPAPSLVDWRTCEAIATGNAMWPTFAQHYEYWNHGALPFLGASEPSIDGFVRERGRESDLDAPSVIALLDAYWPSLFVRETQLRMIATVTFSAELFIDPATLRGDQPLRFRSHVVAMHDGFFLEHRELWHDTQLVAMNQQTVAVLK